MLDLKAAFKKMQEQEAQPKKKPPVVRVVHEPVEIHGVVYPTLLGLAIKIATEKKS